MADFLAGILLKTNEELALENQNGYEIRLLGIDDWKCMNPSIQTELQSLMKKVGIPSEYDRPQGLENRKHELEKEILLGILQQLRNAIVSESLESKDLIIALFFFEFLARRVGRIQVEGRPIPDALILLMSKLEDQIAFEMEKENRQNNIDNSLAYVP